MHKFCRFSPVLVLLTLGSLARGAEFPDDEPVRQAIEKGLRVVEKAAANYPSNRDCFSCHHQTLPMLAMDRARRAGFSVEQKGLESQAEFTLRSFARRAASMREGTGIGGTSMTVGYGLWALELANHEPDETTQAMVVFLLKNQKEEGHWARFTSRPPLEDSNVMCTVLAAYGMEKFSRGEGREQVVRSVEKAKRWLSAAACESQEDKAARLWGLHLLGAEAAEREEARRALLEGQHEDGGWSQLDGMASDAYATGQALFVLGETGLPLSEPSYRRGVRFLLDTQCEDGSWFVESRSKPIQTFFDNGDPHGKNQFIAIPATSWAVTALAALVEGEAVSRAAANCGPDRRVQSP